MENKKSYGNNNGNNNAKRKFRKRTKQCFFTKNNIKYIDYKDVDLLKNFISNSGQILPKRVTGVSSKYQKKLAVAVKRSRQIGLLPFIVE